MSGQGRAYGMLDGGRGLLAALIASATVVIFAALLPTDVASATLEQRSTAFRAVIWVFTGITLAVALLVWVAVPDKAPQADRESQPKLSVDGVRWV